MAFTHTTTIGYKSDAGTITSTSEVLTGDGEANYDGVIPGGTTNAEVDLVAAHANIRSMVLFSNVATTVKVNSSSAPDDTINLPAGGQVVWNTNHPEACPFTVDVTKLFITNAGAAAATVKIRILLDSTPGLTDPG